MLYFSIHIQYVITRMCSSGKKRNTSAASSFLLLITLEPFDFKGRGKTCISGACLIKSKILHSESIEPIRHIAFSSTTVTQGSNWNALWSSPPFFCPNEVSKVTQLQPLFPNANIYICIIILFVLLFCAYGRLAVERLTLWYANSGSPSLGDAGKVDCRAETPIELPRYIPLRGCQPKPSVLSCLLSRRREYQR